MRRGTTPTVTMTVKNTDGSPCDLTDADLYITFKEKSVNGVEITKRETDADVEIDGNASVVSVYLTQEETLSFTTGRTVRAQIRSKKAGIAEATDIDSFQAEEILYEGVI